MAPRGRRYKSKPEYRDEHMAGTQSDQVAQAPKVVSADQETESATEASLRKALIQQPEVTVMPESKETKKEHKTWNSHMHGDAKGFFKVIKDKWDKLTDPDLLMINTEDNLVSAIAKRYEMPPEMAQVTVSDWMKSL